VVVTSGLPPAVPGWRPFTFSAGPTNPALRDAPAARAGLFGHRPRAEQAANLPTLLDSLLASDYNPLEILSSTTDPPMRRRRSRCGATEPRSGNFGEDLPAGWYRLGVLRYRVATIGSCSSPMRTPPCAGLLARGRRGNRNVQIW
jgi:hypothetical protein